MPKDGPNTRKVLLQAVMALAAAVAGAMAGGLVYGGDPEVLPAAAALFVWRGKGKRACLWAYWGTAAVTAAAFAVMALVAVNSAASAGYSDGGDEMAVFTSVVVAWSLAWAGTLITAMARRG